MREFLFGFGHTDGFWGNYVHGFSHVWIAEIIGEKYVFLEPMLDECRILSCGPKTVDKILKENETILNVKVELKSKNRLIRPLIQSCATFVQYIAGISLGALLVQTLYEKLTKSEFDWLEERGIVGVERWEKKQAE